MPNQNGNSHLTGIVLSHRIPDGLFWVAANEAKKETHALFNYTDPGFSYSGHPLASSVEQWTTMHHVDRKAVERSKSAYTSIAITKRLTLLGLRERELRFGVDPNQVSSSIGNCPIPTLEVCPPTYYRSYSGVCNNVAQPEWGTSHTELSRMLKPAYADDYTDLLPTVFLFQFYLGISSPRETVTGRPLPSVRGLSLTLFSPIAYAHPSVTTLFAHWMHFVASDMVDLVETQAIIDAGKLVLSEEERSVRPLPCCRRSFSHPECNVIEIPKSDPAYRNRLTCIPHARTMVAPRLGCALGPREQANMASSYLDGSVIYGSSPDRAKQMRSFSHGHLRTYGGLGELPQIDPKAKCQKEGRCGHCSLSGSDDVNILPGVTALHTVFIKQHNRIARLLKEQNRHWSDSRLFEEARRIVIAQLQHITYNEFLPIMLGRENIKKYGLSLHESGFDSDYDMSVEGAVLNEFAVTFPYILWVLLPQDKMFSSFNNPTKLHEHHGVENILRHLLSTNIAKPMLRINDEIKNEFLKDQLDIGLDLMSIALMLGRDHGIHSYTVVRAQCGLGKVRSFHELKEYLINDAKIDYISTIYENVDDIDLLIGVLAEQPLKGSLFGPTMTCIAGKQFQKTRRGDRFWYENYFAQSGFTEKQLMELRKTTLAEIICSNTDVKKIQSNVFMRDNIFE
ncbi:animal hem peroxidase [Dictyocaulus viviparus]|uniref:Animal hem peroxidase n=1 Tax=Dictyocaulus viviparus TaxID=29172 RepID=A0A0D8Y5C7_DICVI|nr:animal hem peroxidase [Dictyocaulus viviparus]